MFAFSVFEALAVEGNLKPPSAAAAAAGAGVVAAVDEASPSSVVDDGAIVGNKRKGIGVMRFVSISIVIEFSKQEALLSFFFRRR